MAVLNRADCCRERIVNGTLSLLAHSWRMPRPPSPPPGALRSSADGSYPSGGKGLGSGGSGSSEWQSYGDDDGGGASASASGAPGAGGGAGPATGSGTTKAHLSASDVLHSNSTLAVRVRQVRITCKHAFPRTHRVHAFIVAGEQAFPL